MNRILILGATGFIGQAIYKELRAYFDIYGTYATPTTYTTENSILFSYNCEEDSIYTILQEVAPSLIISCFSGKYPSRFKAHEEIATYIATSQECKLLFISSSSVFDGAFRYPSYETDSLNPQTIEGRYFASVEKMLLTIPKEKVIIARLPMVLGVTAPRVIQLQQAIKNHAAFDVYPNLVISATTVDKVSQQIHYLISKNLSGIFHLSSKDVIHHDDLFKEIAQAFGSQMPIFKQVFSSNDDRFLAILPKHNTLPENYTITIEEVIESCTLKDEINTLKQKI